MDSYFENNLYLNRKDNENDNSLHYTLSINSKPLKKKENYSKYKTNTSLSEDLFKIPNIDSSLSRLSVNSIDSDDSLGEINIVEIDNGNENTLNLPCINIHHRKKNLNNHHNNDASSSSSSQIKINVVKHSKNSNPNILNRMNTLEESQLFEKINTLPNNIIDESFNHLKKKGILNKNRNRNRNKLLNLIYISYNNHYN